MLALTCLPLPQPEDDSVTAFRIDPVDVFVRTSDPAASAFVTAFITDMHPDVFPFVDFSWAENRTNFIGAIGHADFWIFYMKMGFRISVETDKVLFFLD